MASGIDYIVIVEPSIELLRPSSKFLELMGTIKEQIYLPPNSKCEICFFKLREAPQYLFQANIPKDAVEIMNLLEYANEKASLFKERVECPTASHGKQDYLVKLFHASIDGYEISFTRHTAKILNQINNI